MNSVSLSRKFLLQAALVFGLALVARFTYTTLTTQHDGELIADAAEYHAYAINVLERGTFVDDRGWHASRMPGYPLFLAAVYGVFGVHVLSVQIAQVLLSAIACVLLFAVARSFLPDPWAFAGGCIGAVYFDFFAGTPRILNETLFIFTMAVFFTVWFLWQRFTPKQFLVLGLIIGAAVLTRPEANILLVLVGFFALWEAPLKKALLLLVFLGAGYAVCLTPWVVRNYKVFDQWVPMNTKGGFETYFGLRGQMENQGLLPKEERKFLSDDELTNDKIFKQKAREFYQQISWKHALRACVFNMAILFYPFRPAYDPTIWFFLPMIVFGSVRMLQRKIPGSGLVLAYACAFMAVYTLLGATVARYRQPISPAFVLLAGLGLYQLWLTVPRKVFQVGLAVWTLVHLGLWALGPQARAAALSFKASLWS